MSKTLKIILTILIIICISLIAFITLIFIEFSFDKRPSSARAPLKNISKVEINYPYSSEPNISYDIERDKAKLNRIVKDINSQRSEGWVKNFGGKEAANVVGIKLYSDNSKVMAFSLYPTTLMERDKNYRQLNAEGYSKSIDLEDLPELNKIWCDPRNNDKEKHEHNSVKFSYICMKYNFPKKSIN